MANKVIDTFGGRSVAKGSAETPQLMLNPNINFGMYQSVPYIVPAQTVESVAPTTPPEPVSEPTYAKTSENFGVMRHLEPVRDHLINTNITLEKLRLFAAESQGSGEPLLLRVEAYLKKHYGEYRALMEELGITPLGKDDQTYANLKYAVIDKSLAVSDKTKMVSARFFKKTVPKIGESTEISLGDIISKPEELGRVTVAHNTHSALFAAGTVMTDDIRTMEALRHALVTVRRNQQLEIGKKQAELEELKTHIARERSTLDALEASRGETLDDYAVAQHLLAEHWQEVEQAYAERTRIIENNTGLYYVRVRETPLSRSLPDPLDLRPGTSDDLVPGCPVLATPLARELMPFMAMLLDIPAADWAMLNGLSGHLPGRAQLEEMVVKRRQNIEIKLRQAPVIMAGNPALGTLLQNHQAMVQSIAARPLALTALRDMQKQGHRILALDDLLASPIPALRDPAGLLHQRLTAAGGCLLSRLRAVKPSIRLAWAGLAENNRLNIEKPELWPQLAQAEADGFNAIRTLVELVGWWFRQLDANASGDSRTAMRNFIRACLLLSSGDNPRQLLQGQLQSLPTRFRPGELLRLNLNREPAAGNLLHLLDDRQQVVALMRVEDHDSNGTLASIVTVIKPNSSLTLSMRVTGQSG